MPIPTRPLFTDTFDSIDDFRPDRQSVYLAGRSVEQRSEHLQQWHASTVDVTFVDIVQEDPNAAVLQLVNQNAIRLPLRSSRQIENFLRSTPGSCIYLDVTGLRHHVWAALLRAALGTRRRIVVVYVEPEDYRPSLTPTENEIFDLSERIEGISPLPGFARLRDAGDSTCFVPLLGFEGARVSYLISQLEPPGGKIVPVVGVPGFRPEYPFSTYIGNRSALIQTQAWKKVRYAQANCPFDLFYVLEGIQRQYRDHILKIAPIGTKPHAVGCILYAIANPRNVEVVYDHPIRKARRTIGTGKLLTYHVSSLLG
jgi:hypothetical protein